jgi:hypothetical protein
MSVCVNVCIYHATVFPLHVNDLLLSFQFAYPIIFWDKRVWVSCANCFIDIEDGNEDSDRTSDDLSDHLRALIILFTIWYWSSLLDAILSNVVGSAKVNCHTVVGVVDVQVHQLNTIELKSANRTTIFLL